MEAIHTVDGKQFTWAGPHGTAWLSDLPVLPGNGFRVRGRQRTVYFGRSGADYDRERDLRALLFRSACGQFTITLWND
jgi:hypothetical protein